MAGQPEDAECLARFLKLSHTASLILVTEFKLKSLLTEQEWNNFVYKCRSSDEGLRAFSVFPHGEHCLFYTFVDKDLCMKVEIEVTARLARP